jgi:hypothetical protein
MRNTITDIEALEIALNIELRYADLKDEDWYRVVDILSRRALV